MRPRMEPSLLVSLFHCLVVSLSHCLLHLKMIPPSVIGLTVKYLMCIFKSKSFIQVPPSLSDFMPGVAFFNKTWVSDVYHLLMSVPY